jgi:hypothetical protein
MHNMNVFDTFPIWQSGVNCPGLMPRTSSERPLKGGFLGRSLCLQPCAGWKRLRQRDAVKSPPAPRQHPSTRPQLGLQVHTIQGDTLAPPSSAAPLYLAGLVHRPIDRHFRHAYWQPRLLAATPTGSHADWQPRLLATTPTGNHAYWQPRLLAATPTGSHAYWQPRLLPAIAAAKPAGGHAYPGWQPRLLAPGGAATPTGSDLQTCGTYLHELQHRHQTHTTSFTTNGLEGRIFCVGDRWKARKGVSIRPGAQPLSLVRDR